MGNAEYPSYELPPALAGKRLHRRDASIEIWLTAVGHVDMLAVGRDSNPRGVRRHAVEIKRQRGQARDPLWRDRG